MQLCCILLECCSAGPIGIGSCSLSLPRQLVQPAQLLSLAGPLHSLQAAHMRCSTSLQSKTCQKTHWQCMRATLNPMQQLSILLGSGATCSQTTVQHWSTHKILCLVHRRASLTGRAFLQACTHNTLYTGGDWHAAAVCQICQLFETCVTRELCEPGELAS
mgnify:CR=1 FL=1